MIAILHTVDGSFRYQDLVTGTLEELQSRIMMQKLSGELVGYRICDTTAEEYKKHEMRTELIKRVTVEEWWDKAAFSFKRSKPGFTARSFMS
jgi:hypothetical protein